MIRLGEDLMIPDIGPMKYLMDAMWRLHPTRNTGWGDVAADWRDIEAFAKVTGRIVETWEAELLYDMCAAYTSAKHAGVDPLSMAPVEQVTDG